MVKNKSSYSQDPAFENFILSWAEKHITKPIQGFEQKTSPGGGYLNNEELLLETHSQVLHAAMYFKQRNKPLSEILDILSSFKK